MSLTDLWIMITFDFFFGFARRNWAIKSTSFGSDNCYCLSRVKGFGAVPSLLTSADGSLIQRQDHKEVKHHLFQNGGSLNGNHISLSLLDFFLDFLC